MGKLITLFLQFSSSVNQKLDLFYMIMFQIIFRVYLAGTYQTFLVIEICRQRFITNPNSQKVMHVRHLMGFLHKS